VAIDIFKDRRKWAIYRRLNLTRA